MHEVGTLAAYRQATRNSYREWRYHMLLVYNYVLLKMITWYSKHVEESNNILRINNIQCITLVILYGQFMMHGQRNIKPIYVFLLRRLLEVVRWKIHGDIPHLHQYAYMLCCLMKHRESFAFWFIWSFQVYNCHICWSCKSKPNAAFLFSPAYCH